MVARMVLATAVLATSLLFAAPSGAQGCYPPPCAPPGPMVDTPLPQQAVQVLGSPSAEPRARELSRTGNAGVLSELSMAAGLVLVGGTLVAITRRRVRSDRPSLDGA